MENYGRRGHESSWEDEEQNYAKQCSSAMVFGPICGVNGCVCRPLTEEVNVKVRAKWKHFRFASIDHSYMTNTCGAY